MKFYLGHGGQLYVGHGGRVGAEELDHTGGTSKGGTGEIEQRKLEERDGVGGIEMRRLHMVEGADSTAKLDGYWEWSQFIQVCGGFDFEGVGLCEYVEGDFSSSLRKSYKVGFGGCACCSSSVAAIHRQVAVAHPRLLDADNDDKHKHDNNNSAQQPLKQLFPVF